MDAELQALVDQWLSWDRNDRTRDEIKALVAAKDSAKLHALLGSRMEFGTAGLRAAMGAGNSRMNDVTVIQAAQGLAAYLATCFDAEALAQRGVVIGYDARHNSHRFAQLSANVFRAAGLRTRLFHEIVATPFVPFALRRFGCVAGVMVTASHNPKQDNGYKVYWSNGAQIVPPHDAGIAACIAANLAPRDSSWDLGSAAAAPALEDPLDDVRAAYFASLAPLCAFRAANAAADAAPIFTYTAMHGVGTPFTLEALRTFGVDTARRVALVKEQVEPDPEFPTVAFPNPEEGKSALNLSFATADAAGSRVILANDPDADRLAVAEKTSAGWRVFSGNQLGALLGWWALERHKALGAAGAPLAQCAMLSSAVSSMILRSMAAREGFHFEETLTGFKWMGSRSEALQRERGLTVLFAFEEAIGFMFGTRVFDKDGVTAAAAVAEMATHLAPKTLSEQLADVYRAYGFHASYNSYVVSRDPARTAAMFDSMRALGPDGGYPAVVAGARVTGVRDLSVGLDTTRADRVAVLPSSRVSPMITFYLDNGVTLTVRGSGTEPKIKWYSEIIADTADAASESALVAFVDQAVRELLRPDHFGFTARTT